MVGRVAAVEVEVAVDPDVTLLPEVAVFWQPTSAAAANAAKATHAKERFCINKHLLMCFMSPSPLLFGFGSASNHSCFKSCVKTFFIADHVLNVGLKSRKR